MIDDSTLKEGEPHPMAHNALAYVKEKLLDGNVFMLQESMASCALSGNRTAEICLGTLSGTGD